MSAFEFTALDTNGRSQKGVLEGDTPRQIRQQLRERGLTPLSVEEVRARGARRRHGGGRVSSNDLAVLTRQLATLVGSGLPLEEGLHVTAQQSEKTRVKSILLAVRGRIKEGHTLADAMGEFPHVFPELYRATVSAGEQTGHLDVVLSRLADYTENREQLSASITQALIYPAVLTLTALLVVALLMGFVVPKVVGVFTDLGQALPFLTRALIASSELVASWGLPFAGLLVVAVILLRRLLQQPVLRRRWHRMQLGLPVFGRLVQGLNTARFARTLSILVASGVPVLDGLRIAASVMANLPMRAAVEAAINRVREGSGISRALDQSGCFPPIVVHLVASGEASGKLEDMLERAALSQENELQNRIGLLMKLFEPALILAMGMLVLVIVLAILLPIFDLNQLVK
ncbi:MAG: type II secretion system inner membrane protein GspF [Granulosicoccaceae bacterium]|jgi:general secretion pathway protein F